MLDSALLIVTFARFLDANSTSLTSESTIGPGSRDARVGLLWPSTDQSSNCSERFTMGVKFQVIMQLLPGGHPVRLHVSVQ
jgi:hypothetical protein